MTTYTSEVFPTETITLPSGPETIVRGGRQLFPLLEQGFAGVRRIGVLGWGPQGRAQALNLRDSLAGTEHHRQRRPAARLDVGRGAPGRRGSPRRTGRWASGSTSLPPAICC